MSSILFSLAACVQKVMTQISECLSGNGVAEASENGLVARLCLDGFPKQHDFALEFASIFSRSAALEAITCVTSPRNGPFVPGVQASGRAINCM